LHRVRLWLCRRARMDTLCHHPRLHAAGHSIQRAVGLLRRRTRPVSPVCREIPGSIRLARRIERVLGWGLLSALGALFLLPFIITLGDSLKSFVEMYHVPRIWIPAPPRWENYVEIFRVLPFFTFFKNTLIITAFALTGQVLSAAVVGYSFARLRWPF